MKWIKTPHNNTVTELINVNPFPAKLIYLNLHPLEIVNGVENCCYLFNLRPNISKSVCLNCHFIHINSDSVAKYNRFKISLVA